MGLSGMDRRGQDETVTLVRCAWRTDLPALAFRVTLVMGIYYVRWAGQPSNSRMTAWLFFSFLA